MGTSSSSPYHGSDVLETLLAAAAAAGTACAIAIERLTVRKTTVTKPFYRIPAFLRHLPYSSSTEWRPILHSVLPGDCNLSTEIHKEEFLGSILPLFEQEHARFNFGSPFRRGPKTRVRGSQLDSIDLLGFSLCLITKRDPIYALF